MTMLKKLQQMRSHNTDTETQGLDDETLLRFAKKDSKLEAAVDAAHARFLTLCEQEPELMALSEKDLAVALQEGFTNFYPVNAINPYVALAASGPWIVTSHGAVVYECGGYGMLGFGHAPSQVLDAMNQPHVMANIMTPSFSQKRFMDALRKEIGHTRSECPYASFFCLNSGSEAVTLGARITDINARLMTDPGGKHEGKSIRILALAQAFHGRTDRPARFSDSCHAVYSKYLASYRDFDNLLTVAPNSIEQLEQMYEYANTNNIFIEAFFIEPVMGEGSPGMAITPEFYQRARELTLEHGSMFLVDSIQAGIRATGVLSICDYPGFEKLDAPDLETYSKALNGGQFPLSVLAVTSSAAELYRAGIYGNTMTTNPRCLDIAVSVLNSLTPELRQNIKDRGIEFLEKLTALKDELSGAITDVKGTGLLVSAELDPLRFKSYGGNSTEEFMRMNGVNVIHGGKNALRYTPPFNITSEEIDVVIAATRDAIVNGPAKVIEAEVEENSFAA